MRVLQGWKWKPGLAETEEMKRRESSGKRREITDDDDAIGEEKIEIEKSVC